MSGLAARKFEEPCNDIKIDTALSGEHAVGSGSGPSAVGAPDAAGDRPVGVVFDDTGFVKDGRMSPCVARQYTGTVGKVTNCQVATTLHLATDEASGPINWRLFMPESWDPASGRAS